MSDEFWKDNKPELVRGTRSFSGPISLDETEPGKVFAEIEFGTFMMDHDKKISNVVYYQYTEKSPLTMSNTIVAVLGSLMG